MLRGQAYVSSQISSCQAHVHLSYLVAVWYQACTQHRRKARDRGLCITCTPSWFSSSCFQLYVWFHLCFVWASLYRPPVAGRQNDLSHIPFPMALTIQVIINWLPLTTGGKGSVTSNGPYSRTQEVPNSWAQLCRWEDKIMIAFVNLILWWVHPSMMLVSPPLLVHWLAPPERPDGRTGWGTPKQQ